MKRFRPALRWFLNALTKTPSTLTLKIIIEGINS